MKKLTLILAFLLLLTGASFSQEDDKKAIEETALNYIEGWYSGDAERMDKALHPQLAKRGIVANRSTGKIGIMPATKEQMVQWTKGGAGKKPKDQRGVKVTILDKLENTASVKIVSADFIDYAHLAKIDGEWKILNVIWEFPPKK